MFSFVKFKKIKILSIVITLFIFSVMFTGNITNASGLTENQINAVVSLLQSFNVDSGTITNIKTSLTSNTTIVVPVINSVKLTDSLIQFGSKGDVVKNYQTLLNQKGFSLGLVDGKFGNKTKQAVINFQKMKNLPTTGDIDQYTKNALIQENVSDIKTKTNPTTISVLTAELPTSYINVQDGIWPPVVFGVSGVYSCNTAIDLTNENGVTTIEKIINNKSYCVSSSSGSAMGHFYKKYTYITPLGSNMIKTTTFNLSYLGCGAAFQGNGTNQYESCQLAQTNFDLNLDAIMDQFITAALN